MTVAVVISSSSMARWCANRRRSLLAPRIPRCRGQESWRRLMARCLRDPLSPVPSATCRTALFSELVSRAKWADAATIQPCPACAREAAQGLIRSRNAHNARPHAVACVAASPRFAVLLAMPPRTAWAEGAWTHALCAPNAVSLAPGVQSPPSPISHCSLAFRGGYTRRCGSAPFLSFSSCAVPPRARSRTLGAALLGRGVCFAGGTQARAATLLAAWVRTYILWLQA
ncbi:hypothetical protein B0J12DRAFT_671808 [Macrophomina phaseolina]|uniref:Uncharacterized protein n=1 Tax=Macrophomina phaseolina TaxID=35725 RepID=A0ABQ8G671_9PEZI|nr:hypothetical protein B0J12DRAFT_671808 [Macrophomina phaseolina]